MKDFCDIMIEKFDATYIVPKYINGPSCVVGQNNNLTIMVAAPGHTDVEKWVVRFTPMTCKPTPRGVTIFSSRECLEERFDSKRECVDFLTNKQSDIYKELFNYMAKEYEKIVPLDELRKNDPHTYKAFLERTTNT